MPVVIKIKNLDTGEEEEIRNDQEEEDFSTRVFSGLHSKFRLIFRNLAAKSMENFLASSREE